jgi:hypothetical protein
LLATVALGAFVAVATVQAEPVQEFSFELKDVKTDGELLHRRDACRQQGLHAR